MLAESETLNSLVYKKVVWSREHGDQGNYMEQVLLKKQEDHGRHNSLIPYPMESLYEVSAPLSVC